MTDPLPSPARSLVVVSAGLGVPSSTRLLADRLAAATERHLSDAGIVPAVRVIELREHAQDLTNHLLTGFPTRKLQEMIDAVVGADGLIVVSPIFNASYSGLFKLFFMSSSGTAWRARRRCSPPPGARPATPWRSTTRSGRSSRT